MKRLSLNRSKKSAPKEDRQQQVMFNFSQFDFHFVH